MRVVKTILVKLTQLNRGEQWEIMCMSEVVLIWRCDWMVNRYFQGIS